MGGRNTKPTTVSLERDGDKLRGKFVFLGEMGVGKSSYCHRLIRDEFDPDEHYSMMGAFAFTNQLLLFNSTVSLFFFVHNRAFPMHKAVVDGKVIWAELWDSSCQERFVSLSLLFLFTFNTERH